MTMFDLLLTITAPLIVELVKTIISTKKEQIQLKPNDESHIVVDFAALAPEDIRDLLGKVIEDGSDISTTSSTVLKKAFLQSAVSVNIFLSYCWKDAKLADEIESFFDKTNISIKRDTKNIEQWGSIRKYMDSIHSTDYVILVISDDYLKSMNCMYEVKQLIKDGKFRHKIFPLVLEKSIYDLPGRIKYIMYWEKKYSEIKSEIEKIQNIENISNFTKDLYSVRDISYSISEFLDIVRDMNNPNKEKLFEAIMNKIMINNGE